MTAQRDGGVPASNLARLQAGHPAHGDSGDFRDRIKGIHRRHNPSMLASGEVDALLARHTGQEHVLYQKVLNKYIPDNARRPVLVAPADAEVRDMGELASSAKALLSPAEALRFANVELHADDDGRSSSASASQTGKASHAGRIGNETIL